MHSARRGLPAQKQQGRELGPFDHSTPRLKGFARKLAPFDQAPLAAARTARKLVPLDRVCVPPASLVCKFNLLDQAHTEDHRPARSANSQSCGESAEKRPNKETPGGVVC